MENIKEAFKKVKEDILFLKDEIDDLKESLFETNKKIKKIHFSLEKIFNKKNGEKTKVEDKTEERRKHFSEEAFKTDYSHFKGLKQEIKGISIGNGGVKTDKQTNRQTDNSPKNNFDEALNLLNSLGNLKREIRLKFKRLTKQELLVFSAIYQIEEEKGYSNYKLLSEKLNLSESSIRDYVRRLLFKKIPLEKQKINNKEIKITISPNLKKIASLNTILELRGL